MAVSPIPSRACGLLGARGEVDSPGLWFRVAGKELRFCPVKLPPSSASRSALELPKRDVVGFDSDPTVVKTVNCDSVVCCFRGSITELGDFRESESPETAPSDLRGDSLPPSVLFFASTSISREGLMKDGICVANFPLRLRSGLLNTRDIRDARDIADIGESGFPHPPSPAGPLEGSDMASSTPPVNSRKGPVNSRP